VITRLLRLFSAFRELETENRSLRHDLATCRSSHEELVAELNAAVADKDKLWATMQEALANERNALRMQINHAVQRSGGTAPYPEAHSLPEPELQEPIGRRGRILPSEIRARNNAHVIEELVRMREETARNGAKSE